MISKFNVGLKTRVCDRLSEPEFYGDLVYKLTKHADCRITFKLYPICLLSCDHHTV